MRDPAQYLRSMVRRARAAPSVLDKASLNNATSVDPTHPREAPLLVVLMDGGQFLHQFAAADNKPNKAPATPWKKRKTWSAVGRILKGAAVAAGNLVPVVAAAGIFTRPEMSAPEAKGAARRG